MKRVADLAVSLEKALGTLDELDQCMVALEIAHLPGDLSNARATHGFTEHKRRLVEERDFLIRLSTAAPNAAGLPVRGHPRNIVSYLVMQDLAAIYECLTKTDATRQVSRVSNNETGKFYQFASAVWPVVFGKGDDGLPAAMKNWDWARRKYREESPLVTNIHLRHPTWGVL